MSTVTRDPEVSVKEQAQRPDLCEALFTGPEGVPASQLADWLLLTQKCMAPAEVIIEFRCRAGHVCQNAKCGPHSRDDGSQLCGYCADYGSAVPGQVSIIRYLR